MAAYSAALLVFLPAASTVDEKAAQKAAKTAESKADERVAQMAVYSAASKAVY